MGKRTRIFIGILLAYAVGVGWLMYRQLQDIDPRYRESAEESLVETSQLLATLVELESWDGELRTDNLIPVFDGVYARRFKANIYGFEKTRVELRLLVVNLGGQVVFDSTGRIVGQDRSQWRDIRLALRGDYGARTSADVNDDASSAVMYVAAPVRARGQIIGAVSVGKPTQSFGQFVQAARQKTLLVGTTSAIAVLLLVLMVSLWLVRPFGIVSDYARYVRAQRSFSPTRLARQAFRSIATAYEEMRDALAGRTYVADYVQTLTHEVKSPLSAIRGAAELLQEPMPDADRARFAANIVREAQRIQELVDRMMELTALESRRTLTALAPVALAPLLHELAASAQPAAVKRNVKIAVNADDANTCVDGDAFLLQRAVSNLLDNAIDFSPDGGTVTLSLTRRGHYALVTVLDQGPGIPAYAEAKVFEKFYSLARPHSRKKSTGLGLSFVSEIASLHQGRIALVNSLDGGTAATLSLPLSESA